MIGPVIPADRSFLTAPSMSAGLWRPPSPATGVLVSEALLECLHRAPVLPAKRGVM